MPRHWLPLLLFAAPLAPGCSSPTHTYDVSVRNDTARPLMVGLAKDGPPYEDLWASPEDLAIESPKPPERQWGVPVPPGKTGSVNDVKGTLDRGTRAYVRVYQGAAELSEFLAIGRRSPNRIDLPLKPGGNAFVVTDTGGRLTAERQP